MYGLLVGVCVNVLVGVGDLVLAGLLVGVIVAVGVLVVVGKGVLGSLVKHVLLAC